MIRFIEKGRHHFGWTSGDKKGAHHIELCKTFCEYNKFIGTPKQKMLELINISDCFIDSFLNSFCCFDFSLLFTPERARFVASQIKLRRNLLVNILQENS
jgi:hypothetical protein